MILSGYCYTYPLHYLLSFTVPCENQGALRTWDSWMSVAYRAPHQHSLTDTAAVRNAAVRFNIFLFPTIINIRYRTGLGVKFDLERLG